MLLTVKGEERRRQTSALNINVGEEGFSSRRAVMHRDLPTNLLRRARPQNKPSWDVCVDSARERVG